MRLPTTFVLSTLALLRLTSALSLAQFQPIVSFPSACTFAYDTPIQGCNAKDFAGGNPCSESCIASLQSISDEINTACVGTKADPTTLIGLFFQGQGVSTLCPNVVAVSAGSAGDSIGSSTMLASSKSVGSSLLAASGSPGTASATSASASKKTSKTSASEPTSTKSRTSTTSTPGRTTTTSTVQSPQTTSSTTTSISLRGGFTSTAVNNGVATVVTSKSQQTSNPDGFGGGGSPFEVGVNGGIALGIKGLETLFIAFVVGMVFFLR